MNAEQVVAFVLFAFATSITPGPNNIMLTATGANFGVRRGLPHMFGISFGFGFMLFIVAAGLGTALLNSPALMESLRYVGIAVLLWLSWKIGTAGRPSPSTKSRPINFVEAVAFQWVNPKAWLICAGAVSGFLNSDGTGAIMQAGLFAGIFVLVGLPCMMTWLGFGAAMQFVLRTDRALRSFNIAMGLLLAASTVLLL